MDLSFKSIIITGGASGIGLAMVSRFLKDGANVAVLDINEKDGVLIENKFRKQGKTIKFFRTDVCNKKQVEESIDGAIGYLKTVDVLVNNAGGMYMGNFLDTTEEQWDRLMSLNLKSIYYTCKKIIPYFIQKGSGNIINMASAFGIRGTSEFACYSTTKSAVIGLTESLAGELARYKIRVNSISPGIIMTPMLSQIDFPDKTKYESQEFANYLDQCFPLTESIGVPNDVANIACFLASNESQWITGSNILVDGGYLSESVFTKFLKEHVNIKNYNK